METLYTSRFSTPSVLFGSPAQGPAYVELPSESGRGFGGWL